MKLRLAVWVLIISCFSVLIVQGKVFSKNGKHYFKLLENYTEKTIPGAQKSAPVTNTHFIILWQGNTYPESFFWCADSVVLACNIVKVRKINSSGDIMSAAAQYSRELISGHDIHKGDTLEITPIANGNTHTQNTTFKYLNNTLFFKTNSSGFIPFHVKRIYRRRNIATP